MTDYYNSCLQRDLEFGLAEEDKLLPLFREKIDKCLCKTRDSDIIDYISPKSYLELKSRNCYYADHDDIMIGANKIRFAERTNKKVYLAFNFRDGVYYYEFKREDLTNGVIDFRLGGRKDRGRDERKMCAYIKRESCVRLDEENNKSI